MQPGAFLLHVPEVLGPHFSRAKFQEGWSGSQSMCIFSRTKYCQTSFPNGCTNEQPHLSCLRVPQCHTTSFGNQIESVRVSLWAFVCQRPWAPSSPPSGGVAPPSLFPYLPFFATSLGGLALQTLQLYHLQESVQKGGNNSKSNKTKWKQQQTQVEMNIFGITRGSRVR